jgi:proteasome lid subunit RPN8/RPN11
MNSLTISAAALESMQKNCEVGYPNEVCGLLVGNQNTKTERTTVLQIHAAKNLNQERAHDRYELDPRDYQRIEKAASQENLLIVGVYHSHPDHPCTPSETDRQRAAEIWQNDLSWSYLIVELRNGKVKNQKSWLLNQAQFVEQKISIEPATKRSP